MANIHQHIPTTYSWHDSSVPHIYSSQRYHHIDLPRLLHNVGTFSHTLRTRIPDKSSPGVSDRGAIIFDTASARVSKLSTGRFVRFGKAISMV